MRIMVFVRYEYSERHEYSETNTVKTHKYGETNTVRDIYMMKDINIMTFT